MTLQVLRAPLAFSGEFALTLFDARVASDFEAAQWGLRRGRFLEQVRSKNLVTTVGLNAIMAAITWDLAQNANAGLGSPLSASQGNLGDVYGAVGTSSTAALVTDTQLGAEIGRAVISSIAQAAAQIVVQFFFTQSQANGVIAEYGVFFNGSGASNSGTLFDHTIPAATTTKASINTAILGLTITGTAP